MSSEKDMNSIKLEVAYAKRNALFAKMQSIYDLSKQATTDRTSDSFLNAAGSISDLRTEFRVVLDEYNILKLTTDPKATPSYDTMSSFEDMYCSCKRVLERLTAKSNSKSATSMQKDEYVHNRIRLPPIEIMSFDGDVKNWPLFYANFKTLVHDNLSLSDDERMYYLIGKLSQRALSVISGITPNGDNYSLILKTLIEKFEDKRLLASTYIEQILNFKMSGGPSASNFQSFIDKVVTAVNALKNLNMPDLTDFLLLHIILKKLDTESIKGFEIQISGSKIPTFLQLENFIRTQIRVYQNVSMLPRNSNNTNNTNVNNKVARASTSHRAPNPQSYVTNATHSNDLKCLCENIRHEYFFKCPAFQRMTPSDRFTCIKSNNACLNCLSLKHKTGNCRSSQKCLTCKQKHHSLLHFENKCSNITSETPVVQPSGSQPPSSSVTQSYESSIVSNCREQPPQLSYGDITSLCTTCNTSSTPQKVLASSSDKSSKGSSDRNTTVALATVEVVVNNQIIRCLLDSASQSNFITSDCCLRLGLTNYKNTNIVVSGVGGKEKDTLGMVDLTFYSKYNSSVGYDMSALIVDRITGVLPSVAIDEAALPHLRMLPLADSTFATPGPIDALIGASLYAHLMLPGMIANTSKFNDVPPTLETVLGFVVIGSLPTKTMLTKSTCVSTSCCSIVTNESIDTLVKRFWELEEVSVSPVYDPNDLECEEHFRATTTRDSTGRYTVALPFREDVFLLGDSRKIAEKRFLSLERKLEVFPPLREAYDNVIHDYIDKGFISPVMVDTIDGTDNSPSYVIPHHGVYKPDKSTKLRPVLDASCTTTSGYSLNDVLHSGPNLQGDLFCILLNFRLFPVAFCADVKQMFLQIGMRSEDRRFQRILYRFNPQDPIQVYEFNRVCFGMKSSPFHALRVVQQLASDEGDKYSAAAAIVSKSLYMDDVACSVPDEETAVRAVNELIQLFQEGQFDLMKWTCNSNEVLKTIPPSHRSTSEVVFDKEVQHKILGLSWSMSDDCFVFNTGTPSEKCTKRLILSTVARLWDVLGFVAPTILYAKLLIKELWLLKCDWDDCPPPHIVSLWHKFCMELSCLNGLKIPRHVGVYTGVVVNVVGFADASERAYGAVIYLHITRDDKITTELVCAKSKLSPTKTLSVARLELCAVELLSRLLRRVCDTYSPRYDIAGVYGFTDSKVVLCWLNSSPHRWQTFVANRVVKVIDNFPASIFFHVAGIENPADCLSRGLTPEKLLNHPLWFKGPSWASLNPSEWPLNRVDEVQDEVPLPEEKPKAFPVSAPVIGENLIYELCLKMSSWHKLLNTIVYLYRFMGKLPRRDQLSPTPSDLEYAESIIIRCLQEKYFDEDIRSIKNSKPCSRTLIKLKPFLENDLIRVGGRLSNAAVDYNHKYPVVLPRRDHVVDLIVDYYHQKYLHAGPELLLSLLRQKFWILAARRVIRHRIFKCNICFRSNPRPTYPSMADLPSQRVNEVEKAFTHTGCDYAGPLQYTPFRGRGIKCRKAWLCIFTCLTTRAIHIELATDLTTLSFLAALKRFLSRRGSVKCLYSDRGTNFVGARTYLKDLYEFLETYHKSLESELPKERIEWKLIPPASPHFGGCWESMVKVVKTHLFKTIGQQVLSYEEMLTVLTQIEALVNSRPLTALSSDPSEPSALTPAHFLCSAPLLTLPVSDKIPCNLQERHSLLDSIVKSFWKRWRYEYLHQLQSRAKWNVPSVPIVKGTVVIVIIDNAPLFSWPLGIVEEAHTSSDGVTRVATIKTTKGLFVRPVVKLCPLPNQ